MSDALTAGGRWFLTLPLVRGAMTDWRWTMRVAHRGWVLVAVTMVALPAAAAGAAGQESRPPDIAG